MTYLENRNVVCIVQGLSKGNRYFEYKVNKMKVAIMQPYLFPYIGYWQLLNAVDKFVVLDDVNFIVRGYINRNRILLNGKPYRFTIPMKAASQNRLIKDTKLHFNEQEKMKFLGVLECAYKKAPFYSKVMPMLERIIRNPEDDLTEYIYYSLEILKNYMDINTELYKSSELEKDNSLRAQDRIIEICRRMKADIYINPCGGRQLYTHEEFENQKMQLFFLDTIEEEIFYEQGQKGFEKNLSIIDVMMFNDVQQMKTLLNKYELNK